MSDGLTVEQNELRIVGVDLSLTATGICDDTPIVYKSRLRGMERLAAIRDEILNVCLDRALPVLVVVEGYAMGTGRQAGTYAIGELGGVIRFALWDAQIRYIEVPPATLKKFATGKGNANKSAMGLAAARNGYDGPGDDNAIDAWWLNRLGNYRYYGAAESVDATMYREEAVDKLEWPAYDGAFA